MIPVPIEVREEIRTAMDMDGAKTVAWRFRVSRVTLYRILWRGEASEQVVRKITRETTETTQGIPIGA
jgi:hypothetical protein